MDPTNSSLELGAMSVGFLGGLALFLFGLQLMTGALKAVAGSRMRTLLARLTINRLKAAFAGAFVTAVIQSSSVTTVLVVGFVSAGLMSLPQSVGMIMGANIGSTVTAQIIALNISRWGLLLLAAGFAVQLLTQREAVRQYGSMVMGLGLIFFGMEVMDQATAPLHAYPPFLRLMSELRSPLLGILLGTVFTALVQSSAATTGIIIVLAGQGLVSLEAGIAVTLGANIGTCVTATLAAIGKRREAVQSALIHVLFNIAGVIVWAGFFGQLAELARWVSPSGPGLQGVARLAAETPRQIANAHTIFNVANTLLFIGFAKQFARLAERVVPSPPAAEPPTAKPEYLDDIFLETPSLALDRVRMELGRLGEKALGMVRAILPVVTRGTLKELKAVARMDDDVDRLQEAILDYAGRLSRRELRLPNASTSTPSSLSQTTSKTSAIQSRRTS